MQRAELVKMLELVSMALASSDLVPIFKCFCFDGKRVHAYNDQIGITANCKTDKAFAVDGSTLLGLLIHSHSETVEFTLGDELVVKAGKSLFKLPYQTLEEFLFKEPGEKWQIKFAANQELLTGIRACLLTTSHDTATAALMGVCFNAQKHTLYSCDSDAITRCKLASNQKGAGFFMFPNGFCETTLKLHEALGEEPTEIWANQEWGRAEFKDYTVYGRLIEVDNPLDYDAEIAKTMKNTKQPFLPVPKGFDAAMARARVVADPESAKTVLTVAANRLTMLTEARIGVVRDVLPFKHPDVVASVSAELVQRSVKLCSHMLITENCIAFKSGENLFQLLATMD